MHRSRFVALLVIVLLTFLSLIPTAAAEPLRVEDLTKVSVVVDGVKLEADAYIVNGRTLVPLRAIFERLNVKPEWDGATRTITATKGSTTIKLTVDQTEAYVGDQVVTLAVPATIINGSTFVPVRFIAESLGIPTENITYDGTARIVTIRTGSGCSVSGSQLHEGRISPQGETWGICGSPHIVRGDFQVSGPDSPVLTIEAGVLVQFEQGASLVVGRDAPAGLLIKGTASNKATLTSAAAGAQPGAWDGIRFYNQTLRGNAVLEGVRIDWAGGTGPYAGAVYVEGEEKLVEVLLKDVEIDHSQSAGIHLWSQARLAEGSKNLKITNTKSVDGAGGFPIVTNPFGSHNLPAGVYQNNDVNAVNITGDGGDVIGTNTTWKNIGIPYASSTTVRVAGNSSPTLTVEPGVISLWAHDTGLMVGEDGPGHLVADAGTSVAKSDLDLGVKAATAASIEPQCGLCSQNKAIVFGAWNASPEKGAWNGISLREKAGDKTRLVGAVIAYAGTNNNYSAGLYAESTSGTPIKLLLAKSLITGAARSGLEFWGDVQLRPESTGNYFTGNGSALRLSPEHVGYLPAGQTIQGNDTDAIIVADQGSGERLTRTATWRNQGVPYQIETSFIVSGSSSPVLTIEPGTRLNFGRDVSLEVGGGEGAGSLVAVGTADKPILFTSTTVRAGSWGGLVFTAEAGNGNRLEYARVEYANTAVTLYDDFGAFIKNTTIRSAKEMGIYREYDLDGTSFLRGLGNQFEGNAVDENAE